MTVHVGNQPCARRRWRGDTVTCFAASAGCTTVGAAGCVANAVVPECTDLHGLLVVGGVYLAWGLTSLFGPPAPVRSVGRKAVDSPLALSPTLLSAMSREYGPRGALRQDDIAPCGASRAPAVIAKLPPSDSLAAYGRTHSRSVD